MPPFLIIFGRVSFHQLLLYLLVIKQKANDHAGSWIFHVFSIKKIPMNLGMWLSQPAIRGQGKPVMAALAPLQGHSQLSSCQHLGGPWWAPVPSIMQ
jgi:hypothetical protein